jgi:hypothetical protein
MGIDEPPGEIKAGENTFYFYGFSGGGVCYPDMYYFEI